MPKSEKGVHGVQPCAPSMSSDLLCGDRRRTYHSPSTRQARRGYDDPLQLVSAAERNILVGAQLGGREGAALVRLGAVLASRARMGGGAR